MKKKDIKTHSSGSKKKQKKMVKSTMKSTAQKVTVGEDEFCPTCMEWRSFDELTGKCSVCGRLIKKGSRSRTVIDEYDLKDFTVEHDEQPDTNEY